MKIVNFIPRLKSKHFNDVIQSIVKFFLPHLCLLCRSPATTYYNLCSPCYAELPLLHYVCGRCSHPFPRFSHDDTCEFCLKHTPLPFDRTFVLFGYQQPITKLIMDLKFGQALIHAKLFGKLLLDKIQSEWYRERPLPQLIIPMPLHVTRLKERGYNQATEIARFLKPLGIPIDRTLCQRVKATQAQATLSAEEREQNIADAFKLTQPLHFQRVAVLDDVMTTGATIISFCRVLKKQGVDHIDVWCCARPNNLSYIVNGS